MLRRVAELCDSAETDVRELQVKDVKYRKHEAGAQYRKWPVQLLFKKGKKY